VSFLRPTTHAKHETTPLLVWFRVQHHSFALRHTPSTKRNPRWCLVVFGVIPLPYNTRRTQKNTNEGVFSCSALFFRPTTHAKHEITPSLVWFRVRHHHFVLLLTPNTSSLRPTTHAEHDKTPSLLSYRVRHLFSILPHMPSTTMHPCWCFFVSDAFPTPPMNLTADSRIFYIFINYLYRYII